MNKHPEQFTVEAWSANAIAFIEEQGLTREFSDWCGGWPCPVDPEMITAAPNLVEAASRVLHRGYVAGRDLESLRIAVAKARGEA